MKNLLASLRASMTMAPDGEGGGAGGDEEQGEDLGQQQGQVQHQGDDSGEEKKPASRFDRGGLSKFRGQEGEGDGEANDAAEPGERPKWLPEKFKSGEAMARAYADLETKLRNGGKVDPNDTVPEDAAGYFTDDFALDESVDRLELATDDPGLKVAADVFKKYGVGKTTAQSIVKDMFKGMNEHAPAPMDPEQELKALGPNGRNVIDGTMVWLEKLDREGKLSDEDADLAVDLMGTARGVRFLNKLRGMTGERSIPAGHHTPSSGGMSPDEWTREMMDAQRSKDYKKQAELEKVGEGIWGNSAASGSPIRGIPEG